MFARLKMVEWFQEGLVAPMIVKSFEDVLYKLYKPKPKPSAEPVGIGGRKLNSAEIQAFLPFFENLWTGRYLLDPMVSLGHAEAQDHRGFYSLQHKATGAFVLILEQELRGDGAAQRGKDFDFQCSADDGSGQGPHGGVTAIHAKSGHPVIMKADGQILVVQQPERGWPS
jgi:hypothetical protein